LVNSSVAAITLTAVALAEASFVEVPSTQLTFVEYFEDAAAVCEQHQFVEFLKPYVPCEHAPTEGYPAHLVLKLVNAQIFERIPSEHTLDSEGGALEPEKRLSERVAPQYAEKLRKMHISLSLEWGREPESPRRHTEGGLTQELPRKIEKNSETGVFGAPRAWTRSSGGQGLCTVAWNGTESRPERGSLYGCRRMASDVDNGVLRGKTSSYTFLGPSSGTTPVGGLVPLPCFSECTLPFQSTAFFAPSPFWLKPAEPMNAPTGKLDETIILVLTLLMFIEIGIVSATWSCLRNCWRRLRRIYRKFCFFVQMARLTLRFTWRNKFRLWRRYT
jgi:hypothetical protein